jgi:hypothetical protein
VGWAVTDQRDRPVDADGLVPRSKGRQEPLKRLIIAARREGRPAGSTTAEPLHAEHPVRLGEAREVLAPQAVARAEAVDQHDGPEFFTRFGVRRASVEGTEACHHPLLECEPADSFLEQHPFGVRQPTLCDGEPDGAAPQGDQCDQSAPDCQKPTPGIGRARTRLQRSMLYGSGGYSGRRHR